MYVQSEIIYFQKYIQKPIVCLAAINKFTYEDHGSPPITFVIFQGAIKVFNKSKPLSMCEFIGFITNLVKCQTIIKIKNTFTERNTYKLYNIVQDRCSARPYFHQCLSSNVCFVINVFKVK